MNKTESSTRVSGHDDGRALAGMTAEELTAIHAKTCYRLGRKYANFDTLTEAEKQEVTELEKFERKIDAEIDSREKGGDMPIRKLHASGGTYRMTLGEVPLQGTVGLNYRERVYGDKNATLSLGEYENAETFYRSVANDIREARYMNVGSGAEGGFSVPESLVADYWDGAFSAGQIQPLCRQYTAESDTMTIIGWDSADHSLGPIGGVSCSFVAEGAEASFVTPKLRTIGLTMHKAAMYVDISREAAQDGLRLRDQINSMMPRSLAWFMDNQTLNGLGVGAPLGAYNSPSLIQIGRTTAGSIVYGDVIAAWGRLIPSMQKNAVWVCSPAVVPELLAMTDAASHFIWLPSNIGSAAGAPPLNLLGRPVVVTEQAPTLGAANDLMLADFSAYAWAIRQGVRLEATDSFRFSSDLISIRVIARFDGSPLMATPLTPANGGDSLSWAVSLKA